MADSTRSDEGRAAGLWAIDYLQSKFSDRWLNEQTVNDLLSSWFHAIGFSELLDLALRLYLLKDAHGIASLLRDLRKNITNDRRNHSRLMLEVAGLANQLGFQVALEKNIRPGLPIDVVFTSPEGHFFGVEVYALSMDQRMRRGIEYTNGLFSEVKRIQAKYEVAIEMEWDDILDSNETMDLLAKIEKIASFVMADSTKRTLEFSGGALTVLSEHEAGAHQTGLTGPVIGGKNNDRFISRLVEKSSQAIQAGATWVRVDALDGLWQFSQWATWPLKEKGDAIANEVIRTLGNVEELHGVILSGGPVTAQAAIPSESAILDSGGFALRKNLSPFRCRETIILPMHNDYDTEADKWLQMYDNEPDWLHWALESVGLPSTAKIFDPRS
jgi:hypothetical protein